MRSATPVLAMVGVWSLVACAQEGLVTEKGTNKPLADVVVVKSWRGSLWSAVQTHSTCYHATYARSDKEGRFSLPLFSWRFKSVSDRRTVMDVVYKAGYHVVETNF